MVNKHLLESNQLETILHQNISTLIEFHATSTDQINQATTKAQKLLQLQVFSQSMMETLVNDLMDLAKLESNNF